MTKTEVKNIVKTCVETLARVKDIELRVFDIRDDETLGAIIFDIRLGSNFGTRLCIDCGGYKWIPEDGKAEFGKAVMCKIWADVKGHLERNEPIYIDPNAAYARTDVDSTLELDGYRLQQLLKQHKDDLLISGPIDNRERGF